MIGQGALCVGISMLYYLTTTVPPYKTPLSCYRNHVNTHPYRTQAFKV